jgi:predicted transcriptional regulator
MRLAAIELQQRGLLAADIAAALRLTVPAVKELLGEVSK